MTEQQQQQHPITPPPELVNQWRAELPSGFYDGYKFPQRETELCIQAARWGADQELEACCELIKDNDGYDIALGLRAARRPKPPSLQEEALAALDEITGDLPPAYEHIIRRALEQLSDVNALGATVVQVVAEPDETAKKSSKQPRKRRKHLDSTTVRQIKIALSAGMCRQTVARQYSVHYSTVVKIARNQTYTNVVV